MVMDKGPHGVDVRIPVGDHHTLRPCRRSARIVDGEQIGLGDFRLGEVRRVRAERRFVIGPTVARTFQCHEVSDAR